MRHLLLWNEEQLGAGQSVRITKTGRNEGARRDRMKCEKTKKCEEQRSDGQKKKKKRGVEVNLEEWKRDAGSSVTEGYFGLHSNDVTSCWHCWTEKQISHLIFAPHFSSSFLLPAHSDNLLGLTTCGSSSFLLSSFVTYLPTLLNVPPFLCDQSQWYPPPQFM